MPLTEQAYRSWVYRVGRLARVGVSDRPQLDGFSGRVGWSNRSQLGSIDSGFFRATYTPLDSSYSLAAKGAWLKEFTTEA